MFEVVSIRRKLLAKRITLIALDEMEGTETLVSHALHGMTAYKAPYHFAKGSKFELRYPLWARIRRGDRVQLSSILNHPDIRRELFWKARQLARG